MTSYLHHSDDVILTSYLYSGGLRITTGIKTNAVSDLLEACVDGVREREEEGERRDLLPDPAWLPFRLPHAMQPVGRCHLTHSCNEATIGGRSLLL